MLHFARLILGLTTLAVGIIATTLLIAAIAMIVSHPKILIVLGILLVLAYGIGCIMEELG
jgi:hypothetical protein